MLHIKAAFNQEPSSACLQFSFIGACVIYDCMSKLVLLIAITFQD